MNGNRILLVILYQNFIFLYYFCVVQKRGRYYFAFPFDNETTSVAILSQIKLIDARRLSRKIGDMNEKNFRNLIEKLKALLP